MEIGLFSRIGPAFFNSERASSLLSHQVDDFAVLLAWLRDMPERKFDVSFLRRWGFLSIEEASEEGFRRWEVKRIVLGSGNVEGFRASCHYASHHSHGGRKTFCKVDFHTLETQQVSIPDGPSSPITSDVEVSYSAEVNGPLVNLSFGSKKHVKYLEWLDEYCCSHKDTFVTIGDPGHRNYTEKTKPFRTTVPTFCRATYGECVRASLANALSRLVSTSIALEMLRQSPVSCTSLAAAQLWLEKNMSRYRLRNCGSLVMWTLDDWMNDAKEGMFLVRLIGTDSMDETIDHAVVLEANHGLLIDPLEGFALEKRTGVFSTCLGDMCESFDVSEIRIIEIQPSGKGKKKRRKSHRVKRDLKRENQELEKNQMEDRKNRKRIVVENSE